MSTQNIFNRVACETNRKNTGFGNCVLDLFAIKGAFICYEGFKIPTSALQSPATTIAFLTAAAEANNPALRIYPVHDLVNPKDNSDDKTVQTYSDGSEQVVREGLRKWMWDILRGKLSLQKALRTHNANDGFVIFYDSHFTLFGWGKDREIYPIPLNWLWADPFKQNDGSNATAYSWGLTFDGYYINDSPGWAVLNQNVKSVTGLRDVAIVVNSWDSDTGLANVSLLTEDSQYNLYDLFSTNFSGSGKNLWAGTNGETGGIITITSVVTAAGKTFDVQFAIGDSDYPAVDGTIILDLVAVSALAAANVIGYEGTEATLEVSGS